MLTIAVELDVIEYLRFTSYLVSFIALIILGYCMMMKQAKDPIKPEMGSDFVNSTDPVSEEEFVCQLEKSSKSALMLSDKKREFLLIAIKNQKDILCKAKLVDSLQSTSLEKALSILIPMNNRLITREAKNSDLAKMIAKLLPPLKLLETFLNTQFAVEMKIKPNLRSAGKKTKLSPLMQLLYEAREIHDKIEFDVYSNRTKLTNNNIVKPILLSASQREAHWSEKFVPKQSYLQNCVICGHKSTNLPPENEEVKDYNKFISDKYTSDSAKWNQYQQDVSNGKKATPPKGLSRRPSRKASKEPIVMCMCSMSYCLGDFDTAVNSCPIKCIDDCKQEGMVKIEGIKSKRYPFIGKPKMCSCPICSCKCNFACAIKEVPKIMLWKRQKSPSETSAEVEARLNSLEYENAAPEFLKSFLSDSMKVAWTTMKHETAKYQGRKINPDVEEYIENRSMTSACQHAATNIVSKSSGMTIKDRKDLRQKLGKPSTRVLLPSGDYHDTKNMIGSNKHAKNNRLDTHEASEVHPGMQSNLEIDWNNQCDDFVEFIETKAKGDEKCFGIKKKSNKNFITHNVVSTSPKGRSKIEPINLLNDINHSDDNDSVIYIDIKKPKSIDIDKKVLEMHNRLLQKARTKVTKFVKERLLNKECAETKQKLKYSKKVVNTLECSDDNDDNHIKAIKAVTDGGTKFITSGDIESVSISSDDLLEMVMVYHDID